MTKTGWPPPPLMQDDNPQLSRWFATRPDARYVFKRNIQMNGMDAYYNGLLAEHQAELDRQAELEEEMDKLKDRIAELLEDNHPAELERLTGVDDVICKKVVNRLYMEGFNDRNCWEPERVGDIWVIFGKNFSGEWIDEDGNYLGFDTRNEAMQYIKETFK